MKREISSFSNKIFKIRKKVYCWHELRHFASKSYLLTDIVDQLHEPSRKITIVDHLSRYLAKDTSIDALKAYLRQVKNGCPDQPVIHIDDSDIVKLGGYKFDSLDWAQKLKATIIQVADSGSGQSVLHTVNSVLSWPFELIKDKPPKVRFRWGLLKCLYL